MFANVLIMAAWTLFLSRKPWGSLSLFTIAVFIHPLLVVQGIIFIILAFLLDYSARERVTALLSPHNIAAGIVFAAAFFFQYAMLSAEEGEQLSADAYVRIIGYDRHPGDFIPSLFDRQTVIAFALAAIAAAIMMWRLWAVLPRRSLIIGSLAAYAAMALAGYLFVEVWPVRFFIQLVPYRFAFVGAPVLLLVISVFAANAHSSKHYLTAAGVMSAFILASPFAREIGVSPPVPAALMVALAAIPIPARFYWRPADKVLRWTLARERLPVLMLSGVLLAAGAASYFRRGEFIIPETDNQHPIYEWVKANTHRDAVFLLEQHSSDPRFGDAVNPQKMRLIGRRAVVASKDFPFLEADMKNWYDRWVRVLDKGAYDHIENANPETLLAARGAYAFDYVLRRRPLPPTKTFSMVASFPSWREIEPVYLYRVLD
jgi:hypothetical protein